MIYFEKGPTQFLCVISCPSKTTVQQPHLDQFWMWWQTASSIRVNKVDNLEKNLNILYIFIKHYQSILLTKWFLSLYLIWSLGQRDSGNVFTKLSLFAFFYTWNFHISPVWDKSRKHLLLFLNLSERHKIGCLISDSINCCFTPWRNTIMSVGCCVLSGQKCLMGMCSRG